MSEFETRTFNVIFAEEDTFDCTMEDEAEFKVDFGSAVQKEYRSTYRVVPSSEQQELPTANKILTMDIIVDPIPSNYGQIIWNGSTLNVI